ncbi:MAG: hypothetical protein ABL962_19390, partial [Fimbriimonadaceae bacterium]
MKNVKYSDNDYLVMRGQVRSDIEYPVAFGDDIGVQVISAVDHPESNVRLLMLGIINHANTSIS